MSNAKRYAANAAPIQKPKATSKKRVRSRRFIANAKFVFASAPELSQRWRGNGGAAACRRFPPPPQSPAFDWLLGWEGVFPEPESARLVCEPEREAQPGCVHILRERRARCMHTHTHFGSFGAAGPFGPHLGGGGSAARDDRAHQAPPHAVECISMLQHRVLFVDLYAEQ